MFTLNYEYKLVPTPGQVATIEQTLNVCRQVWNFALRERKDWINSRKCAVNACSLISEYIIPADAPYPNYHKQAKSLTKAMSQGMLCKYTLDAGFGQFLNILSWTCWKRGAYFAKVSPNGTSQICPKCDAQVKKELSVRVHHCPECGYTTDRDVASAQVIRERGITAAGQVVAQIACGGDDAGAGFTQPSCHPLRQETLRAILGNPLL